MPATTLLMIDMQNSYLGPAVVASPRAARPYHDQVDVMGSACPRQTHHVDLIMQGPGWRAVPDEPVAAGCLRGWRWFRCSEVANLGEVLGRRPEPPLLQPSLRNRTIVVVVVATMGFAALALRYAGGSSARWFDGRFQALVDDTTPRPRPLALLIQVGSPAVVVTTAILTALACLWFGRRRLALLAIVGPGLTGVVTTLSKPLIGRTIDGAWAYPSGHTGGATSLALVAAFVLVALLRPNRLLAATLIGASAVLAGAAMTVLLVAADWHYATDAVGGFLVAVASVLGCALLIDVMLDRRSGSSTVYSSRG